METFARGVRPTVPPCALMAVMSGWFFVRNFVLYDRASPMSYDTIAKSMQAPFERSPDRGLPLARLFRWED